MHLDAYLADLENRIDVSEERRICEEWRTFLTNRAPGPVFHPTRKPASPSRLEWPAVNINDAIEDPSGETMLLGQLAGVNAVIGGRIGQIPMMRANYGSNILPTMFGCRLHMMERAQNTLPGSLPLPGGAGMVRRLLQQGVPDVEGGQGRQVLQAYNLFIGKLRPYPKLREWVRLYHPDAQGPLDIAEVIYGSEIFLAFYDEPGLIRDFLALITDTYIAFMDRCAGILHPSDTYNFHYGWMHQGRIRISLDSCVNFSPDTYREFILPCDRRLLNRYGGIIHSCGKVDHFAEILPEIGAGYHGFNLSQPEMNDMDRVFASTIDRGIRIFGLGEKAVQQAIDHGRDLRGLVHSHMEPKQDSSKLGDLAS